MTCFFGTEGVYRSGVAHDLRMMSNVDIFLEAKQVLHVFFSLELKGHLLYGRC